MKALFFLSVMLLISTPSYALIAGGCGTGCVTGAGGGDVAASLELYLMRQALVVAAFYLFGYILGRRVQSGRMSASLSRKALCLITFGISFANSLSVPTGGVGFTCVLIGIGCLIVLAMLASLSKPLRSRVRFLETVFCSINRPEDVPYTLRWLASEAVMTSAIIAIFVPTIDYMGQNYVAQPEVFYGLMLVPIFASGIGDALAEIVGKKWGRHHYNTRAVFGGGTYTRSFEGSAMVFITTVVVGVVVAAQFSFALPVFFWKAFALLPFTLTLAEAKAPHTWDNPLLYLVGYLTIFISLL